MINRGKILLVLITLCVFGCKKDDEDTPPVNVPTPSNQEILISHYWKLYHHHSTMFIDTDNDGIMEIFRFTTVDTCSTNAKKYFKINGYSTMEYTPGCGGGDSVSWHMSPDGTVLTVNTYDYNVISINNGDLKIAAFIQELNPQVFLFDTLFYKYP